MSERGEHPGAPIGASDDAEARAFAPASEQAALVRAGELSARDLVAGSLDAIERLDPALNAFVALCPERALAEADGVHRGDARALCGVPAAVKDLGFQTEGLVTTHGSRALGDWVPDHDDAAVRRLRDAGAIVVGKTNTCELGLRPLTEPERFGPTRNPWDPQLGAGGSSGGSAAAVASGMVALALGSDMAGSIRIPASSCGLVGLKPSRGRVSTGPDLWATGLGLLCAGVLTRTVGDTALALDLLSGPEPGDHSPLPPSTAPFRDLALRPPERVRVRFALAAPGGVPVEPEPREATTAAAELLESLGHEVEEARPDWDDEGFADHWRTLMATAAQHFFRSFGRLRGRPLDPELLEPATRALVCDAPEASAVEVLETLEHLGILARRILAAWPEGSLLVTPTLARLPGPVGRVPRGEGVRFSAFTRLWNITGQPAISLPVHATSDGVPVGVQVVGPPGGEGLLLSLAAQIEAAAGWAPRGRPAVAA